MEIEKELLSLSIENRTLYSVQIEVTTNCNWKCRHCYIPNHNHAGLSRATIHDLFLKMRKLGVFEVTLTGGEIFTRSDIIDIISEARDLGFRVFLYSNISLLNEKTIKTLCELYVSEISCTIFSMKSSIHDYITQVPGSLNRTLENLNTLKRYGCPVEVKTIVMSVNSQEWKEVESFCKENGFSFGIDYDVFAKVDGDTGPTQLRITTEQMYNSLQELDSAKGFEVTKYNPLSYVCDGIRNSLFIDSYGNIYPCVKYRYLIDNISSCELKDVWDNSVKLKRIQDMRRKDLKDCSNCNVNNYCFFCPGTALLEDGNECNCSSMARERAEMRSILYR